MRSVSRLLYLLAAASILAGCGGGGNSSSTGGRLSLKVIWPKQSRLIPQASNSIKAILTSGSTVLGTELLTRPFTGNQTQVTFENLQPGSVTLSASAYPNADATGVAQASGSSTATITSGQTAQVTVDMTSTIASLTVTPVNPTINVGGSVQLTATARDALGSIVLISAATLLWNSATPASAPVNRTGLVSGQTVGTSLITAVETESGKSGSTTVTVTAPTSLPDTGPGDSDVDPSGQFYYVLDSKTNNISQFRINSDGTLAALNPPTVSDGGGASVIKTVRNANGSFAYVTVPESNLILQYKINADGTLTPLSPASLTSTADQPVGIAIHPNGQFLYIADGTHANGLARISQYRINSNGTLSTLGPDVQFGFQIYEIVISSDGKWVFTSDNVNDGHQAIQIFAVNNDGTLTRLGEAGGHHFVSKLTLSKSSPFLYASFNNIGGATVQAFQINSDGSLTAVASELNTPNSFLLTATPDGKFVYAPAGNNKLIFQFKVNSDGSLTAVNPPTLSTAPMYAGTVRVSIDGKYAYVSNFSNGTISMYRINADGTLTPLNPPTIPG